MRATCAADVADAAAMSDVPRFARLNRQFHALLADTPSTQRILQMLNGISSQTAAIAGGFEVIPGRIGRACREHQEIMAAIAGGDYQRAAALLAEHERRAGAKLIAALGAAPRSNGAS